MSNALPPRFPISADQIDAVVAEFYAVIRTHPGLGPVFAAHVRDWPAHEAKIARFWRNAILFERSYDGNPEGFSTWIASRRSPPGGGGPR
jgi:hemoglobin